MPPKCQHQVGNLKQALLDFDNLLEHWRPWIDRDGPESAAARQSVMDLAASRAKIKAAKSELARCYADTT